jgi:hypothetical protein
VFHVQKANEKEKNEHVSKSTGSTWNEISSSLSQIVTLKKKRRSKNSFSSQIYIYAISIIKISFRSTFS